MVPGDRVHVRMTKWVERPHWEFDATYLGDDEHGTWLGLPRGTQMLRPGAEYVSPTDQLGLVPPVGRPESERGWFATFHGPGGPLSVYVDVVAPPTWDGPTVAAVDLDLDVVRELDGTVWVDDEDEFAEHQVELDYPPEVVMAARASCDRLVREISSAAPPYDGAALPWFEVLRSLRPGHHRR
nr:DUF402 domain-containing protein [Nocardioides agariphilus]